MTTLPSSKPSSCAWRGARAGFLAALLFAAACAGFAQSPPSPAARPAAAASQPQWSDLNPAQQQALEPLAAQWKGLSAPQKRKWLALSHDFERMPPQQQATLHGRMTEWADMSAQERSRARLNYAEAKRLAPASERKAKWEAYQALSEADKRKLAQRAGKRPPTVAAPAHPVPAHKLASTPSARANDPRPARIERAPAPGAGAGAPAASLPPPEPPIAGAAPR